MKKFGIAICTFALGLLVGVVSLRTLQTQPYDLTLHRSGKYELWISLNSGLPLPMSPFDCVVRFRTLCEDTGNICSDWKTVADFPQDSPSRASEWKVTDQNGDIQIEFPEQVIVRRTGDVWTTKKAQ